MTPNELRNLAEEYHWHIEYDEQGQLIFITGVFDETKRVDIDVDAWDSHVTDAEIEGADDIVEDPLDFDEYE